MIRFTSTTVLMMLVCGCGQRPQGAVLTAPEFFEAFVTRLQSSESSLSVERRSELELVVSGADGTKFNVFLDNAYQEYQAAPEGLDELLERYAQSTLETIRTSGDDTIDLDRIVPVIKDAAYPGEVRNSLVEAGYESDEFDLYSEPLNEHLIVLYAVDTERNIRYLHDDKIQSLGLKSDDLRQRSVDNLRAILPDIEKHGGDGTFMVTAGGTYEASLLLFNEIWSTDTFSVRGEMVVAVPGRDLLLVTGSDDAEGLAKLRKLAAETVEDGSYRLTAELFVRRDGKWLPLTD